ncbi:hypothetical protein [Magnetococcus sp. PR-3]|uniref:hypothetical protein n=1 Tax=Magnetococcus sp. PR-3 TaxID=3120355 RepID=UPI002FCE281A
MLEQITEAIFGYGPTLVTLASIITATTKTPKDEGAVKSVYRIIEALAIVTKRVKT